MQNNPFGRRLNERGSEYTHLGKRLEKSAHEEETLSLP